VPMQLLFVGDVMLGRLVNKTLSMMPADYPWGDTLPIFHQAGLRICNLECVLSERGTPWSTPPKTFYFRSDAKNVATLTAAQIDAVSLANNHTLDFGYQALDDCLHILHEAGIHTAGAGMTRSLAWQPAIWEVQGHRIALVAFTDNEPIWEATEEQPGIMYVPMRLQDRRAQRLMELVSGLRDRVDLLLISAHWGPNWGETPPPEHPPFAHALIDRGADIIFGHSGHIMRGIEIYKGKPILYCTGDYIDDYAVDPHERNDQGGIFLIEADGNRLVRLLLYPTIIKDFQATLASESERGEIAARMQRLCAALNTEASWNGQEQRLEIWLG
jgi:poly-gamma-glutamate capsule biosynthesis protein CapA/YwtB (metallophosphatase superfamily)